MSAKRTQSAYSEKLKDPRWQRKRLEILNRDDFTCRCCYSKENTLHVHHSHYRKGADPWDYDNDHLVTLCEDCHKSVEAERDELLQFCTDPDVLFTLLKIAKLWNDGHGSIISTLPLILSPPLESEASIEAKRRIAKSFLVEITEIVQDIGEPTRER